MKIIIKNSIVLFMLIGIAACSTYLYEELAYVEKGMSKAEVFDIVTSDEFSDGLHVISNDMKDNLHEFEVNGESGIELFVSIKYHPSDDIYYLFLFKDDKLLYWGLPYEFANHTNELIKEASIKSSNILATNYLEE